MIPFNIHVYVTEKSLFLIPYIIMLSFHGFCSIKYMTYIIDIAHYCSIICDFIVAYLFSNVFFFTFFSNIFVENCISIKWTYLEIHEIDWHLENYFRSQVLQFYITPDTMHQYDEYFDAESINNWLAREQ